jgi:hypothetical protein
MASPGNTWEDNIKILIECDVLVWNWFWNWRALVNIPMNLPVSQKTGNFFIGSVTISLLKILLHGVQMHRDAE